MDDSVKVVSFQDAAEFGEILILAINPWNAIEGLIKSLKGNFLSQKILIDVSNNIIFEKVPKLAFSDLSMGEFIQALVPEAYVVKTLNLIPASFMVNPEGRNIPPIQWIAGNNGDAKTRVRLLLNDLGWNEVFDIGGIEASRFQEAIGLLLSTIVVGMSA